MKNRMCKWSLRMHSFDVHSFRLRSWSFGILMWEAFTLGGTPYPGLPTEHLLDYISEGKRMDQPKDCPLEVYAVMRDCWAQYPDERPNFQTIVGRLGDILERNVSQVSGKVTAGFRPLPQLLSLSSSAPPSPSSS